MGEIGLHVMTHHHSAYNEAVGRGPISSKGGWGVGGVGGRGGEGGHISYTHWVHSHSS